MAEGYEKAPCELRKKISFVNLPSGWTHNYNNYVIGKIVILGGMLHSETPITAKSINFPNIIPEEYEYTGQRLGFSGYNNATDNPLHGIISNRNLTFYRPETENLTDIEFSVVYAIG